MLTASKVQMKTVTRGDTIFIFGGNGSSGITSEVSAWVASGDYFELTNNNLSSARCFVEPIAGDSAIYAVGGITSFANWPTSIEGSNAVDIYKNGVWTTHVLPDSISRCSVVKAGSKIVIGGLLKSLNNGTPITTDAVHIYDELTNTWSVEYLSESRANVGIAANDSIVMFAGGWNGYNSVSDVVDFYNVNTGVWTTGSLSQARFDPSAVFVDGKFIVAGGSQSGTNASDVIDIYDGSNWTTETLAVARSGIQVAVTPSRVLFIAGGEVNLPQWVFESSSDVVDIYDRVNQTWTSDVLNDSRANHAVGTYQEAVYVFGGIYFNSSGGFFRNSIEKIDYIVGQKELLKDVLISPNPASDHISIQVDEIMVGSDFKILDNAGRLVESGKLESVNTTISTDSLKMGLYFLKIDKDEQVLKFVKN